MNSSQLGDRLRDLVDGDLGSAPPTGALLERGRRARRGRRNRALAGAASAVLALGMAAAVAIAGNSSVPAQRPPVVSAPATSPQLELAAAITNSQNISFRLKSTVAYRKGDGKTDAPAYSYSVAGAFDPATATGYLRAADGSFEVRLISGVLYSKTDGQWLRYKGTYSTLYDYDESPRGQMASSVDSQQLLRTLRQGDAKVTKTGAQTYHFEATTAENGRTVTFAGTISLDGDKRVAGAEYAWRADYEPGGFTAAKETFQFSDYGSPVTVETPPGAVLVD